MIAGMQAISPGGQTGLRYFLKIIGRTVTTGRESLLSDTRSEWVRFLSRPKNEQLILLDHHLDHDHHEAVPGTR